MADDNIDVIDIEEHDIMDHPRIKEIFPDLNQIKHEIGYTDEGLEVQVSIEAVSSEECDPYFKFGILLNSENLDFSNEEPLFEDSGLEIDADTKSSVEEIDQFGYDSQVVAIVPHNEWLRFETMQTVSSPISVALQDAKSYLKTTNKYCAACLRLFSNAESFYKHMNTEHREPKVNLVGLKESGKSVHQATDGKEPSLYKCNVCGMYLKAFIHYVRHLRKMHNVIEVPSTKKVHYVPSCDYCKAKPSTPISYKCHMIAFHRDILDQGREQDYRGNMCHYCGKIMGYARDLRLHISREHRIKTTRNLRHVQCDYCKKILKSKRGLTLHIAWRHQKTTSKNHRRIKCNYCKKKLRSKGGLKLHIASRHQKTLTHINKEKSAAEHEL